MNIKINKNTNINLNDNEIEIIKITYSIFQDIIDELCKNNADETEVYGEALCISDSIYEFMKNVGINIKNDNTWIDSLRK